MTDNNHPITPPPELVKQWNNLPLSTQEIIAIAWRNGADTELEACCEWMSNRTVVCPIELRAARRPKPPSLAKTATYELDEAVMRGDCITTTDAMPHLRAALKRLAELEDPND